MNLSDDKSDNLFSDNYNDDRILWQESIKFVFNYAHNNKKDFLLSTSS